jgi:hypothetical protein
MHEPVITKLGLAAVQCSLVHLRKLQAHLKGLKAPLLWYKADSISMANTIEWLLKALPRMTVKDIAVAALEAAIGLAYAISQHEVDGLSAAIEADLRLALDET